MTHGEDAARRNFVIAGEELVIGGVTASDLATEFGTPLFVYDTAVLARRLGELREALQDRVQVFYSIKANPNQALLKWFTAAGCGLEIASEGEFYQAVQSGCDPSRILFAGPGKTADELRFVIERGIGEIHAESFREIEALEAACRATGRVLPTAVRINPRGEAQGGAMRMGGKASQFGFDEELMEDAIRRIVGTEHLDFCGVHLFVGTQILDADVLARQYAHGVDIAIRAADIVGRPLRRVDFGGGLGIPYYPGDRPLDVKAYGDAVRAVIDAHSGRSQFSGTEFLIEPGRFLVGESGVYVTRVLEVKKSRDRTFAIVDGGMHHHLAASGNLGQVIKRNYPVAALQRIGAPPGTKVDVVGPLCTPLDVLARNLELPELRPGDLVGVFQSGAYGRTSSPMGFLSHPTPAEVLVDAGTPTLIRRRGTCEDLLCDQLPGEPAG